MAALRLVKGFYEKGPDVLCFCLFALGKISTTGSADQHYLRMVVKLAVCHGVQICEPFFGGVVGDGVCVGVDGEPCVGGGGRNHGVQPVGRLDQTFV